MFDRKLFLLSLLITILCVCLLKFPSDDGLRHIGIAFNSGFKSWGDVYPSSQFEVFRDYNPWFGYDLTLRAIAVCLKCLPLSPLLSRFLFIKILSLIFSSVFFYLILQRSGILDDIRDRGSFILTYLILFVLAVEPFSRIILVRPFAFGSFFLLYAMGRKGIIKGALSSAVLTFFYPYLAWFYTIPTAFAHFFKGDKKFALGALSLTIFFLCLQPCSFWGFQSALFKSDHIRGLINSQIGEFNSTFSSLSFYIYLSGFLFLYPLFSGEVKKLNCQNLLIILYLLPALKYVRYFIDLILPLLFVSFGREMLKIFIEPYRKFTSYWGKTLLNGLPKLKLLRIQSGKEKTNFNLKPYIAVSYTVVLAFFIYQNCEDFSSLKKFQTDLSVIPTGTLILTDFNLQYKTLYLRPDLHIIPSCEMGFSESGANKEYIDFFNEGNVVPLARKTGAKFFLEHKRMYINPQDGKFLELVKKSDELRIWKVSFSESQE